MKVEIRDKQALSRLSLVDIRGYLTSSGWTYEGRYGDVASIFVTTDTSGRRHELLLPMREDFRDFADRISDIIFTISMVENREQLSVFYDLIKSGFDVLRFRASLSDDIGTIA